jgi:ABC-2 type transport system permease protein
MVRVMLGTSVAFLEDIWSRNFLNLFSTPLRISEYLCGLILVGAGTSLIGLCAMFALAVPIFGLSFVSLGWFLVHAFFVLLVFGITLGVIACGIVLRFGPAAEWLTWPIPALLAPFAGVFYPVSTLPGWMQTVAAALPPSRIFEAMRAALGSGQALHGQLWTADALVLLYLALAVWAFRAVFRHVVGTGQLARYAAEVGA